jgi:lipid-binding SYLF domain-containing protein
MTRDALEYFEQSSGYEIGMGPTITVVDAGIARKITTTTARDDVYAFIYGNQGLMGGLGLRGSKITPIHPD